MPFIKRLFLPLLTGFLIGCLSPVSPKPPDAYSANYWGTVSALRDGKPLRNPRIWAVDRTPCNKHAFDILITEFTDKGDEVLTFSLVNIPKRKDTLIHFKADYSTLYCTKDTVGSTLTANEANGYVSTYVPRWTGCRLSITSYDSVKREVKGTFTLRLRADARRSSVAPDSVQIQQGQFYTKLKGPTGKYE